MPCVALVALVRIVIVGRRAACAARLVSGGSLPRAASPAMRLSERDVVHGNLCNLLSPLDEHVSHLCCWRVWLIRSLSRCQINIDSPLWHKVATLGITSLDSIEKELFVSVLIFV
jgi:hypothetical protein